MKLQFISNAIDILIKAGLDIDKIDNTINGLVLYYSNNRYYHGFGHINWMLDAMHEAGWDDLELSLAILFHDVYYIHGCKYNEYLSAKMAGSVLKNCNSAEFGADNVFKMIMATSRYMEYNHGFGEKEQKICDLDLSSLAREPYDDFIKQQKDILAEAGSVDLSKSSLFLSSLLIERRGELFYTEYAKDKWLAKACENINTFSRECNGK